MSRSNSVKQGPVVPLSDDEAISSGLSPRYNPNPNFARSLSSASNPHSLPHKRNTRLSIKPPSAIPESQQPPLLHPVVPGRSKLAPLPLEPRQPTSPYNPYRRGLDEELVQRRPPRQLPLDSISRTPSIKRNLSSVTDLTSENPRLHPHPAFPFTPPPSLPFLPQVQRSAPALLLALAFITVSLRALPGLAFPGWTLPDHIAAQGSLQFFLLVIGLAFTAALFSLPPSPGSYPLLSLQTLPAVLRSHWKTLQHTLATLRARLQSLRLHHPRYHLHLARRYLRLGPKTEDSPWLYDRIYLALQWGKEHARRVWEAARWDQAKVGPGMVLSGTASGDSGAAKGINRWFEGPPVFPPWALPGVEGLGVYLYPGGARYEGELYRGRCNGSGVFYFRMDQEMSTSGSGFGSLGTTAAAGRTLSLDGGTYFGRERVLGYNVNYGTLPGTLPVMGPMGGTVRGTDYGTDVRTVGPHGYGRYEGDWVDGKYDGYGIEAYRNGCRYKGQFRAGLRQGYGVYLFPSGDRYSGSWRQGQAEGVGVQSCADGSRYVGEFLRGEKHGLGMYQYRNGDVYSGQYFCDRMNGFGVYSFANNRHFYEGSWFKGKKEGFGSYQFQNGEARAGMWQKGLLQSSSTNPSAAAAQPPDGPVFAVPHSKVLHAVQEARQAAEKAEALIAVESYVSKAVSAASRAAMAARVISARAINQGTPPVFIDH